MIFKCMRVPCLIVGVSWCTYFSCAIDFISYVSVNWVGFFSVLVLCIVLFFCWLSKEQWVMWKTFKYMYWYIECRYCRCLLPYFYEHDSTWIGIELHKMMSNLHRPNNLHLYIHLKNSNLNSFIYRSIWAQKYRFNVYCSSAIWYICNGQQWLLIDW